MMILPLAPTRSNFPLNAFCDVAEQDLVDKPGTSSPCLIHSARSEAYRYGTPLQHPPQSDGGPIQVMLLHKHVESGQGPSLLMIRSIFKIEQMVRTGVELSICPGTRGCGGIRLGIKLCLDWSVCCINLRF